VHRLTAVLERLPGDLEQEPLLRVDAARLARRDAEERGVELVDPLDEAAPAGVDLPGRRRVGVVQLVDLEASGRALGDGIDAVTEQLP
jgi:hypothetical protein